MQKRLLAWRIFTRPSGPGRSTSRDVRVLNVECCPLSIHFLGLSLDLRSYEQFCDKTQKLKFLQLNFWQNLKQSFVLIGITWHLNNSTTLASVCNLAKTIWPPLDFFGPLKKRKIIVFFTLPSGIFFGPTTKITTTKNIYGIVATIHTRHDSQCLQSAGFLIEWLPLGNTSSVKGRFFGGKSLPK